MKMLAVRPCLSAVFQIGSAAPEPRQPDILRVEHGELAPGLPVVEVIVHDPVVVGMQPVAMA